MSTIIVAAIVVASLISISIWLIQIHNRHQKKSLDQLLDRFRQFGISHQLSFSGEDVFNQSVIGMDPLHRKILVVYRAEDEIRERIIDVDQIRSSTVKRSYGRQEMHEPHLEKIVLHFEMRQGPTVELVFFDHLVNHVYQMAELEQKARHWETFLTKMQKPLQTKV